MTLSRHALFTLDFERPPQAMDRLVRVHGTAMAGRTGISLPEEDTGYVNAARAALDEADRIESLLSAHRDSTELARVNRDAIIGARDVHPDLIALLRRCQLLYADT